MRLVFHSESADPKLWRDALCNEMPELEFRIWPDVGDPAVVEALLVWKLPPGGVARFPNLKCLHLISVGTDQIADYGSIPRDLPMARLVEPGQMTGMVEYVLHAVLHYHRAFDLYRRQQAERIWQEHRRVPAKERKVGVLGLGMLGGAVASSLAKLEFDVAGWSRHPRSLEGVTTFAGWKELDAFLRRNTILVAMLPLTPETQNLFDRNFFAKLPLGSYFVNVGRGAQCVEADLCSSLRSGHLAGATLDVLQEEPPAANNPLWTTPNIVLTPHIATSADPASGARIVAENLRRVRIGLPPINAVERPRGG